MTTVTQMASRIAPSGSPIHILTDGTNDYIPLADITDALGKCDGDRVVKDILVAKARKKTKAQLEKCLQFRLALRAKDVVPFLEEIKEQLKLALASPRRIEDPIYEIANAEIQDLIPFCKLLVKHLDTTNGGNGNESEE